VAQTKLFTIMPIILKRSIGKIYEDLLLKMRTVFANVAGNPWQVILFATTGHIGVLGANE